MLGEEDFKRVELLRHSFDIIEAVHAYDQLDTLKLALERGDALLDLWFLETLDELLGVDANREGSNRNEAAMVLYPVRRSGCRPALSASYRDGPQLRLTGFWSSCSGNDGHNHTYGTQSDRNQVLPEVAAL